MKKFNRKKLVVLVSTALMIAIIILMSVTPLGYIPINPVLKVTLICIPVIIGTVVLGLKSGIILGLTFAITSICQLPTNPLAQLFCTDFISYTKMILTCLVPRLCIPVVVYYLNKALEKSVKKDYLRSCIVSVVGSLTNTVLFLGFLFLMFNSTARGMDAGVYQTFLGVFSSATMLNATLEIAAALILCTPIIKALSKTKIFNH